MIRRETLNPAPCRGSSGAAKGDGEEGRDEVRVKSGCGRPSTGEFTRLSPARLGLLIHLAEELKRVVQIEGDRVRHQRRLLEARVEAGLAAAHVVRLAGGRLLAHPLEKEDEEEDLHLRRRRHRVPPAPRGSTRVSLSEARTVRMKARQLW
eukprot:1591290-Prymnesium_polylepis.3